MFFTHLKLLGLLLTILGDRARAWEVTVLSITEAVAEAQS